MFNPMVLIRRTSYPKDEKPAFVSSISIRPAKEDNSLKGFYIQVGYLNKTICLNYNIVPCKTNIPEATVENKEVLNMIKGHKDTLAPFIYNEIMSNISNNIKIKPLFNDLYEVSMYECSGIYHIITRRHKITQIDGNQTFLLNILKEYLGINNYLLPKTKKLIWKEIVGTEYNLINNKLYSNSVVEFHTYDIEDDFINIGNRNFKLHKDIDFTTIVIYNQEELDLLVLLTEDN